MTIRRATPDDAYTMARMRQAMAEEMQADLGRDPTFRERAYVYWFEMLTGGALIGWLLELDGQPIGMASLLLHHHPPRPFGERRRGYVTGVYVVPAQRRKGYGRELMETIMAYGLEQGLQRLELRSSDAGRPLYAALGFAPMEVLMLNVDEGSHP